jgi:hypothetical protein
MTPAAMPLIILKTTRPSLNKVRLLAQVVRALVPGVLLVIAPMDASILKLPEDFITLDAEVVEADPLAVAVALHRGAGYR